MIRPLRRYHYYVWRLLALLLPLLFILAILWRPVQKDEREHGEYPKAEKP